MQNTIYEFKMKNAIYVFKMQWQNSCHLWKNMSVCLLSVCLLSFCLTEGCILLPVGRFNGLCWESLRKHADIFSRRRFNWQRLPLWVWSSGMYTRSICYQKYLMLVYCIPQRFCDLYKLFTATCKMYGRVKSRQLLHFLVVQTIVRQMWPTGHQMDTSEILRFRDQTRVDSEMARWEFHTINAVYMKDM